MLRQLLKLGLVLMMTLGLSGIGKAHTMKVQSGADPIDTFVRAIARAEGFGRAGTIPTRYHNPGDLRSKSLHAYPGQVGLNRHGYVIFHSDAYGWAALRAQIELAVNGRSRFYSVNDTLKHFAKRYATGRTWVKNVCSFLAIKPDTRLWEILDVAPVLEGSWL